MTSDVQVIFFDAVGTLFGVRGSVGRIYSEIARRSGVITDSAVIEARFRAAFRHKSLESLAFGQIGIQAEKGWWMDIVRSVFASIMAAEVMGAYFDEVFEAFRSAAAYELYEETRPTLERLHSCGYRLAVLSNFDSRLFDVLANLKIDTFFEHVILSWHVGTAKPDPAIFRMALKAMNVAASGAMHVGDSLGEDITGAAAAGICAILLDRDGRHRGWTGGPRLDRLHALFTLLPGGETPCPSPPPSWRD
jgi:putative hydrolase of the HAD superfamily